MILLVEMNLKVKESIMKITLKAKHIKITIKTQELKNSRGKISPGRIFTMQKCPKMRTVNLKDFRNILRTLTSMHHLANLQQNMSKSQPTKREETIP
jgi:hypothetical protein